MGDDKATVFVGKRAGGIVGIWDRRPATMDVEAGKRAQDDDLEFEELPATHADVVAFSGRLPPRLSGKSTEQRLAELEAEVAALKRGRA